MALAVAYVTGAATCMHLKSVRSKVNGQSVVWLHWSAASWLGDQKHKFQASCEVLERLSWLVTLKNVS